MAQAVFVSPSIFYAADSCYAERIISGNQQWAVLVEAIVRPGSYTDSISTLVEYNKRIGEPKQVEYRVEKNKDSLIYMVNDDKNNIFNISIMFILIKNLENINNYYWVNIQSDIEKNILNRWCN